MSQMVKPLRLNTSFLERTVAALGRTLEHAAFADQSAANGGLLQQLDPRVKLIGALLLIGGTVATSTLEIPVAILVLSLILALLSRISLHVFAARVWVGIFFFTGLIALPAICLTPGTMIARLPWLDWSVTAQGLLSAVRLILRTETTATVALVLVLSTPWTHVLKALRVFKTPVLFVTILGMTHRYIFLLLQLARNLFEARKSRHVGSLDGAQKRHLAASGTAVLLSRSLQTGSDVFLAMQSRGFRGEVYIMDEFKFKTRDWVALAAIAVTVLVMLRVWR